MGINAVQYGNVSAERGAQFVRFTEKIAADENAIIGKILNGTITTEEQRAKEHFRVTNQTFEVLPDEYRQLANRKNKTPEEIQKMKDMYKNGFLNFSASYIKHIDSEYGNNDNKLTAEEFVKSQLDASMEDELSMSEQRVMAENIFSHLDRNKDGVADKKEVASMMSMFDMSIGHNGDKAGGIDGKIKVVDYNGKALNLVKPSSEEGGAAMDTQMDIMYNFLFGNN